MDLTAQEVARRTFVSSSAAGSLALALTFAWSARSSAQNGGVMPTQELLERLASYSEDGPIVILNLVKYNANPGAAGYARYSLAAGPILRKHGGGVPFAAQCEQPLAGVEEWDAMALLEFPTRKAFADMMNDPEYQAIAPQREESLERAILYLFTQEGPR